MIKYPLPLRCEAEAEVIPSVTKVLPSSHPALQPMLRIQGPENSLNTYLTGLFEGDGHIWIPNINSNSSKKHNPRFCITFNLKDKPLAEKLLKSIGYGFIRIKLKDNACVLTVSPLEGLIYVIQLLNGNMRTPKIHQLHSLID